MHYQDFEPTPALRGRVRYWRLTGRSSGAEPEPVLPDGCVELIVHLGDPFLVERDGRRELQARVLCAGPGTAPVRLSPAGRIDVIGVRLEAGLARELLRRAAGDAGRSPPGPGRSRARPGAPAG